ncbi:MAG: hypothetical protein WED05_12420 [Candidatus Atabeyarchaeum deiterrae]
MGSNKYKFVGILLIATLLGFSAMAPASGWAPSWMQPPNSSGKYAKYQGGINLQFGNPGEPTYIKILVMVEFNWEVGPQSNDTTAYVTGSFAFLALLNITMANMSASALYTSTPGGYEWIDLSISQVIQTHYFDLFMQEQNGHNTTLWVESIAGMQPSPFSIGGRSCVKNTGNLSIPIPMIGTIGVTKYYDTQTHVLMAEALSINATALGIGSFLPGVSIISFPVVMNSTNIFSFSWNIGGDIVLWLEAAGILFGLSVLFAVVIRPRRK